MMLRGLLLSSIILVQMVLNGQSSTNINVLLPAVRKAIEAALSEANAGSNLFQSDAAARFAALHRQSQLLVMSLDRNAHIMRRAMVIFSKITGLSWTVILKHPKLLIEWRARIAPVCSKREVMCDPLTPYRTVDGTCNNLISPLLGSRTIAQGRVIQPFYDDGLSLPRMRSVTGGYLPNPRLISNVFHSNTGRSPVLNRRNTNMFVSYGQFLGHDISLTPVLQDKDGKNLECCRAGGLHDPRCFPIPVPPNDPVFRVCKNFARSAAISSHLCDPSPRLQINQLTSFIDGSTIYSSTPGELDVLREKRYGRLRLTARNLPLAGSADMCTLSSPGHHCFLAGDGRRHEVPTLTTLHVIFAREHNNLARGLRLVNPHWGDERLFQEARRILGAELQHITFFEYLPFVLGNDVMIKFGLKPAAQGHREVYDPTVDPSTTSGFSTAAFRFGHSQTPTTLGFMAKDYSIINETPLHTHFDRPDIFFNTEGSENLIRWLTNSNHEENDRLVSDSVRNHLFRNMGPMQMDLAAANIQRGRDHGIPPYNVWREWCGLRPVIHLGNGQGGLVDHDGVARMFFSKLYRHPNDIDLFTAGVSEQNLPGASVGPTFACIIAKQFVRLQRGDRFYYENANLPGSFTADQLNELKKTTLAAIHCKNSHIKATQPHQFIRPDHRSNPQIPCRMIPSLNLKYWQEHSPVYTVVPLSPVKFLQAQTVM